MPIYLKRPNVYRIVIFIGGGRKDSLFRGTKAEAGNEEARLRLELAEGRSPKTKDPLMRDPTFSKFCLDEYGPVAISNLRESTWRIRKYVVASLVDWFGDMPLSQAGRAEVVEGYKQSRKNAGLGNVAVNNELRVLRRVLRYAREDLQLALPVHRITFFRQKKGRRVVAWSQEEVARLLQACEQESPAFLPVVIFLANTGCRRGEVLAITWDQVDLERRLVTFWHTEPEEGDEDVEWQPKGTEREVPISDALFSLLYGPRQSEKWVFPCPGTGTRYAFWPSRKFDRARDAAGLRGGAHKLRHTFASLFLAARPDLFLLSKLLGHTHARVTEIYSHLYPEHLALARNVVSIQPPQHNGRDQHVDQAEKTERASSPGTGDSDAEDEGD